MAMLPSDLDNIPGFEPLQATDDTDGELLSKVPNPAHKFLTFLGPGAPLPLLNPRAM